MIHKLAALLVATLLAVTSVPVFTYAYAQNATSITNTTTTETNTTIPGPGSEFPAQLPVFPFESANQTNQTAPSNETQTEVEAQPESNVSKADTLLDEAQIKIDEARALIASILAQLEAARQQPGTATNGTDQIIQDANETAQEIKDIVEGNLTDSEVIGDVGNMTEDIQDAINDTIESAPNATVDNIENVTDEAIEVIENATDSTDNSTIEVALDNAMIRLLTGLVSAQDYNLGLTSEERDDLKANLQDAIAELASDAADSLR